ncbi:hypothetical protein [Enterobacter sp.]|uniref:hypothetical protein n=1 Tax=Enterobacter sp. TaxID=42895 RepID=UPI00296FD95F|nr:hypothetical protein [Enterobacter sp.]
MQCIADGEIQKVLIVTAENGFFAQSKMPWSSMDVLKIKSNLERYNFTVQIVTFAYLKENIKNIRGYAIIYTSSQRIEHKKYIEDIMYFFKDLNVLIPSYENLLAHDNKGFQALLNKKYSLGMADCDYYCDVSELASSIGEKFPLVYKSVNGASSMTVKLIRNYTELEKANTLPLVISKAEIKRVLKKYIFKSRYNAKWEEYLCFGRSRFVLQKFIPDLKFDFKVLVFGEKYYLLKRFVADNDFKASGSGLHSRDIGSEKYIILDFAKQIKRKIKSHIYSLDIGIKNDIPFLIELQMTHVGPVTLTESESYYTYKGFWEEVKAKSNLEDEFSSAIKEYLNESNTYCS